MDDVSTDAAFESAVREGKLRLPSEVRDVLEAKVREKLITQEQSDSLWERMLPTLRRAARIDFNFFAELVATDDETGEPMRQAPIHKKWAELCENNDKLLIWSHINSGKTTQLSVLRTVWGLGKDPTLRYVILSNTKGQAEGILRAIARLIEKCDEVQAIFPALKPDPAGPWTNTKLRVVRPGNAKDPSVRAVGVHGDITGGRVDRLVVDDILDPENCESEAARKKLSSWYRATTVGRQTRRYKVLVVGTAYHPKDLLHELSAQKGWVWKRFPVVDENGKITWPGVWTQARIDNLKAELGPAEFTRQLLCQARDDESARFKWEWIKKALDIGDGLKMLPFVEEIEEGAAIFTGVDLAVKRYKRSDETVFLTFLEDAKGRRRILDIEARRMTGPEIITAIKSLHKRYGSIFVVENNAAQDYILQFITDDTNIPVVPHTTGRQKRDPVLGVEGMAIELYNAKWVFPNDGGRMHPELEKLVNEMLFYSPIKHTGDRLMAAYFARDKARDVMGNGDDDSPAKVSVRIIGESDAVGVTTHDSDYFEVMDL